VIQKLTSSESQQFILNIVYHSLIVISCNHGESFTKSEGIVNVCVSPLTRCLDSWGIRRGRSKAVRVQRVRTVKWCIPMFKFHVILEFYPGIASWKSGSPRPIHATEWIWNIPRVPRSQTMGTIHISLKRLLNDWLGKIIDISMLCLMCSSSDFCRSESSDDLEGSQWGLIKFPNGFVLESQRSILLGLDQSDHFGCINNTHWILAQWLD
jgi:hypothetical protein